jgi:hypothetical protein
LLRGIYSDLSHAKLKDGSTHAIALPRRSGLGIVAAIPLSPHHVNAIRPIANTTGPAASLSPSAAAVPEGPAVTALERTNEFMARRRESPI